MRRVCAAYLPWYQSTCVSTFNEILFDLGQGFIAKPSMYLSYWRQIYLAVR